MAFVAFHAQARVKLPAVLGDHMVLQRETKVNLWGWAAEGKKVTVAPSWDKKVYTATAGRDGKWIATVETPRAGGPYSIVISDGEPVTIGDILIGEVWLCSGQSNMAMPVRGFDRQPVEGSLDAIIKAKPSLPVRMCTIKTAYSKTPVDDCTAEWNTNTPSSVARTSATAYFFARYVQEALGVPVGIIVSAWGGSKVEAWMDRQTLGAFTEVDLRFLDDTTRVAAAPKTPCVIFNAMMAPLTNYTIRGMLWYQGESNSDAALYRRMMAAFVGSLRRQWGQSDFPFYYVQIAPYQSNDADGTSMALIREAQLMGMKDIPGSGMATTLDAGDRTCIHPPKKAVVGERLAYWALAKTYGVTGFNCSGPVYKTMEVKKERALLTFDNAPEGVSPISRELAGFEIAGADRVFHKAHAVVNPKDGRLAVWSENVTAPVAVRYAFHNYAEASLFDSFGIPASSFRTDDWEDRK